ncbi:MAG: PQQ-binding-like beta-propeller repeat protein [Methanobacterium sp. ERen5]|nr:MAG: PQQ-binding-like beta-propeller repeat protein [Methanobacterium sp. ERen5]
MRVYYSLDLILYCIRGFVKIVSLSKLNLKTDKQIKFGKIVLFLGLILFGAIIFSGAVSAAGLATSPQPKFHHDSNNTGQSEYKGPQTNTTKWKFRTGRGIASSPIIGVDGTIYIGSADKNLYALYPNGTVKWSFNSGYQIGYTPAIEDDGTIYLVCSNKLYALYPNGSEKWNYTPEYGNTIGTSPAIGADGTIYIGISSHRYLDNGILCALKPDGTLKWNCTVGSMLVSTPAIGSDGTIYLGTFDNHLYAVYPNGTQRWNFTSIDIIVSSPAIGSDGTLYFGCEDHNVYALNPDGSLKWKYLTGNITDSSPAIANNGTIYILSQDKFLYALTPSGNLKWKYCIYSGDHPLQISSPAIGHDGIIYVGSGDGCLYAVKPDGSLKWKYQTGNFIDSSPCIGCDGTLYIGSEDNNLYAIHDKTTPPNVSSNIKSGVYNTTKTVKLTMDDYGTIYYTLNGKTPTTRSNVYTGPITIKSTTILKYFAVDLAGNSSQVYTMSYTIDKTAPKITKTTPANNAQGVALTTPITIKFSEKISKGTNFKNIYIKNMSTGKITHTTVTISGNTITIKMLKNRLNRNKYEVYIPTGAVKDLAGNRNSKYLINFKTRA